MSSIIQCDKCKKRPSKTPDGWSHLSLHIKGKHEFKELGSLAWEEWDLCEKCGTGLIKLILKAVKK
ncbi:MAG: hypothetical protein WC862_04410 [Patescibacteria group bacterium]